ncbi:MAG TPA: hypothetical protein VFB32_13965 [Rudaea sp.]|nr:hypothetical protein [Rudaea sp.]
MNQPDADIDAQPRRSLVAQALRRHRLLANIAAVVVSAVSIWVAFGANTVQERMLAASVWPHLSFITENQRGDKHAIDLTIVNSGTGPLQLEVFNVYYGNDPIHNSDELLEACCGSPEPRTSTATEPAAGRVIRPGESIDILTLPQESPDDELWKKLNHERYKVHVQACYCSVLHDCWKLDTTDPQVGKEHVASVRSCAEFDDSQMWKG